MALNFVLSSAKFPTIFVVRNATRTSINNEHLSTYGLLQSHILTHSLNFIVNKNGFEPISKVITKNKYMDVAPYDTVKPFIKHNSLQYNTFFYDKYLQTNNFELNNGSLLISGNLEDLWGDENSKQPQEGSILHSLNNYYNLKEDILFPQRGKFIYEYNFYNVRTYNTFY